MIRLDLGLAVGALLAAGCASTAPEPRVAVDGELARASASAATAFEQGLLEQAARLYDVALRRARMMDRPLQIGNAAYNRAACLMALGRYRSAQGLLREARWELNRAGANLADVLLLEAKVARQLAQPDEALGWADAVLHHPRSAPTPLHRLEVSLLKGHLACDRLDGDVAGLHLAEARGRVAAGSGASGTAGVHGLAGRVKMLAGQPEEAARQFDRQAVLLQEAQRYRQMFDTLGRAGQAYAKAGRWADAAERLYRAARSAWAHGDAERSTRFCQAAARAVGHIEAPQLSANIQALQEQIREPKASGDH